MSSFAASSAIAVARAGQLVSVGAARAALRNRWPIHDQSEPGLVKTLLVARTRVLVLQLDESAENALFLVQKLSSHFNPVRCVVIDVGSGTARESLARQAGAAAYLPHSTDDAHLESVAHALASPGASALRPRVHLPSRSTQLSRA